MAKEKEGKKPRKAKKPSERWKKYLVKEGKVERTGKFCPRCGAGVFLAKSKSGDRLYCGRCHYTSFDKEEIERTKSK